MLEYCSFTTCQKEYCKAGSNEVVIKETTLLINRAVTYSGAYLRHDIVLRIFIWRSLNNQEGRERVARRS